MREKLEKLRGFARSATLRRVGNGICNAIEKRLRVSRPRSYPLLLDVVLTKACNLNCIFCISSTVEDARWLDFDLYERVASKLFPYARNVSFCSGGEPLLYPRIRDALRLADRYRLKTLMVSNAMLLDEEVCRWMTADRTLRHYAISFDGSTKATLERIRRGAKFERIVENVRGLTRHKQDAGTRYPRLALRYSVMKSNAEELPGICELARSMGVPRVDVSLVNFANEMDVSDSLYWDQEFAAEIFRETAARAKERGITVNLPPLPRDDGRPRRCGEPWRFVQIETDGSVRFCYRAWIQTLGHFDDGFERIWRGDDYAKIRRTLHTDSPHFPYCAFCSGRCGTDNQAAHNQRLHADAYTFDGNSSELAFNKRSEENRASLKIRQEETQRQPAETEDAGKELELSSVDPQQ